MSWDEEREEYFVTIRGERTVLPHSLAYGLFTGYMDYDFCVNGISDEEAKMFYGVDAKRLRELIKAFGKENHEYNGSEDESDDEYSDDISNDEDDD